jgi:hypothetical protein
MAGDALVGAVFSVGHVPLSYSAGFSCALIISYLFLAVNMQLSGCMTKNAAKWLHNAVTDYGFITCDTKQKAA